MTAGIWTKIELGIRRVLGKSVNSGESMVRGYQRRITKTNIEVELYLI